MAGVEFQAGAARVRVNVADQAALLAALRDRFARGQGFAVATLNLDHLVKLRDGGAFAAAYAAQDFVTADGNPIVWIARAGGERLRLVPGSDLILPAMRLCAEQGVAVGLLGATEAALDRAGAALEAAVPGLRIALRIAPPMGYDPLGPAAGEDLRRMQAAGVGLCLLALGAPKQEVLAARGRAEAPAMGFLSIGAGLDFLAGTQRRAPDWVRRIAMEWLWRMLSDPRRLARRYALSALVLPGHLWRAWRGR